MTGTELNARLEEDSALVVALLSTLLDEREMPQSLRESMAYSLFAGGKRLRPALCLESCRMLSGDMQMAAYAACALEMIHTYSLIHDDLPAMDNDAMRRGKPSNHMVFGEASAILAGDGLLSLAMETLARYCNPEIARAVTQGAMDMVAGQSLDLSGIDGEQALYEIHRLKTGALIRASVLSGACCASATKEDFFALSGFSDAFGLLFQITDDILDVTGEDAALGKTAGKDERAGKLTFTSLYGLDGARLCASRQAAAACESLAAFADKAAFFIALIDKTLYRSA